MISRLSLRYRVLLVMIIVALSPLIFIILAKPYDHILTLAMKRELDELATLSPHSSKLISALEDTYTHGVWLPDNAHAQPLNSNTSGTVAGNLSGLFEEDSIHWFAQWEARRPPVESREVTQRAAGIPTCLITRDARLLVCQLARRTTLDGVDGTLYLSRGNVRHVRTLSPGAVLQLCLQSLLIAVLLGLWLGRHVVRPIERLRAQTERLHHRDPHIKITSDDHAEIGQLAQTFNALLEDLNARQKNNERFAADIAHEIKNPLATILASADNMEDGLTHPDQLAHYTGALQRSASRIQELVDQFLTLARAEAGLEHVERAPHDLAMLVRRALTEAVPPGAMPPELRSDVHEPVMVFGAERYLLTVLEKLLENALAVVDGQPQEVWVTLTTPRTSHVQIEVCDHGPGIAPEDLPEVFERFFSRRATGTGLGLPIAQAIVQAHEGTLTVHSTPGEGSCFRVTLPRYEHSDNRALSA